MAVSVLVGVGSRYEQFDVNGGASHFLEHLLFQGTVRRPSAKQLAEEIDAVGGWNDAYTSNELTNYYVKVPRQHGVLALDILSDIVQNPLFDPEQLERERDVIVEEMNLTHDEPARFLADLLAEVLWPKDPVGRPIFGSEAVVRSISREAILNHKKDYYRPNNMVVAVAGQMDHQAVTDQVARQMGQMKSEPIRRRPILDPTTTKRLTNIFVRDTSQTHVLLGCQAYPYNHPDETAAKLVTAILGRGPSSRLYLELREERGLAYDVSADYSALTDTGSIEIYAGVNSEKAEGAILALLEELGQMRQSSIGKGELFKAKNQLRGSLQMSLESNSNVADRLGSQLLLLGKVRVLDELLTEIDAVTVDDVNRVSAQLFSPDRLRLAVIGPEPDKIKLKFEEIVGKHARSQV